GTGAPKEKPAQTEKAPEVVKEVAKTEAKAAPETPKAAKAKAAQKSQKKELEKSAPPKVATPQPPITNGKVAQKPEKVVLFAPNFLMPKPTAKRRRPGPNMSMFMNMAQDMKVGR
ncbi:MAG: hypothetical protein QNJ68_13175, partial [Microcoleaceae cyanobacterium MO_207.B10]|nr:hypothetical protein [Microcoleaceae cyanobacterium MO_207.B10]